MKSRSRKAKNRPDSNLFNKAVCYIRVSTLDQSREGVSLDAQDEKLRKYCAANNLDPIEIIREEGVSAGKPMEERPGGARLLDMVRTGKVQNVVSLKLDRLFRDAADALNRTREWEKAGVSLHLADMGGQSINTASAMGKFFLGMMAGFAELERNLISERTAMALAFKREQGKVYSKTPYGFDRHGDNLTENQEEIRILHRIEEMRAAGISYHKIAAVFNKEGIPTKQRRKWYASTIRRYVQEKDLAA